MRNVAEVMLEIARLSPKCRKSLAHDFRLRLDFRHQRDAETRRDQRLSDAETDALLAAGDESKRAHAVASVSRICLAMRSDSAAIVRPD